MKSAKIILLCMASAIVYGNCHDQVTARVCVEYFTVGHVPPFSSESPTVLAFFFGTMATWWVGLIFGVLLVLVLFVAADEAYLVKIVFVPWVVTGLLYLGCWVGGGRGGVASSTANKQKVSGNLS